MRFRLLLSAAAAGLLAVWTAPAAETAGAAAAPRRFLITDHGAQADSAALNTQPIQQTIEACAAAGGGIVVVPRGTFLTGSIFLQPGVSLEVEAGGVLKGSQNTNDYPWIATRIAGLEMKWPAALVNAEGLTNVTLSGTGTIDGSGLRWWRDYWAAREKETRDVDPHFKVPRPRLVEFMRCQKVLVRDLTLKDPAFWNLQVTYCDGVEIRALKVRAHHAAPRAASSDGIDIDSTCNVLITGCDIECDDDGICLKAGRDADGLRVNRPTENVVIRDCRVGPAAGLVVFGSETSGGIRNVQVYHCRADRGCGEVVRFKTRVGRGGVVEDVLYQDIEADGVRSVFSFNMEAFGTTWIPEEFRQEVPPEKGKPVFRNIRVTNLKATHCVSAGRLTGLPESPLQDLALKNVDIQAQRGFTIRNAVKLRFENVKINGKVVEPPSAALSGAGREGTARKGEG